MTLATLDDILVETIEEEPVLARPSNWSAALSQLPGFPADGRSKFPHARAAREVTSALQEELEELEELEDDLELDAEETA